MVAARKTFETNGKKLKPLDSGATQKKALLGRRIIGLRYDPDGGMWLELDNGTGVRFSVYEHDHEFELSLGLDR